MSDYVGELKMGGDLHPEDIRNIRETQKYAESLAEQIRKLNKGLTTRPNPHVRTIVTCAECGIEKGETNHWFVADGEGGIFRVQEWGKLKVEEITSHALPLCGQACLHKALDRWVGRRGTK